MVRLDNRETMQGKIKGRRNEKKVYHAILSLNLYEYHPILSLNLYEYHAILSLNLYGTTSYNLSA